MGEERNPPTALLESDQTARPAGRRVGFISLGCPKNLVDTEIMLSRLRAQGHELVGDIADADTVIVNTCGFIDEAKQESIDTILDVASRKGEGVESLWVAGCMVNRYADELQSEIPEIDGFVGLDDLRQVGDLVRLGKSAAPVRSASHLVFDHHDDRLLTTEGYAYLKVAEGCNNPCTFCAIPVWRGRFRSRSVESLVAEAREMERRGVRELVLLAQDTTRYGEDLGLGKHGLLRLVEALLSKTSVPWIRFLYAYPTTLDVELLELMGSESRFCSYLDMPLQHSHPEILRAMRRGGSAHRYRRILDRARELVPDISLRSTFITGFPGETEEHFADLLAFVEDVRFDHLGVFTFSHEEDTPSSRMADPVPREVARRRRSELLDRQEPIALERRQRLVGETLTMLIASCEESEHLLEGRHQGMAPEVDGRVLINDGRSRLHELAEVEVTEAFPDDLVGRIVGPAGRSDVEVALTAEEAVTDPTCR